jgi:deoxyribodipyrimidine photo-lyase
MKRPPILVWFRRDLRLRDQPALDFACKAGGPVIPVHVDDAAEDGAWPPGGASRWWLHRSLAALDEALRQRGSRLVVRAGCTSEVLLGLARETGASGVVWNRRYEPAAAAHETAVKQALLEAGLEARSFHGSVLFAPGKVLSRAEEPLRVFTPFWAQCGRLPVREAGGPGEGEALPGPRSWPRSERLEPCGAPAEWAEGGGEGAWRPGEAGAQAGLEAFLRERLAAYAERRGQLGGGGTSRLSAHLHFGEIGPVQVWHAAGRAGGGAGAFLRELGWREFAAHVLFHFPGTPERALRPEFDAFPWTEDEGALRAWREGRTGYPVVDAAMRELRATGWMDNRARMVVASFLVKHLLHPWQAGARWFWEHLADADLANNTLGWQWSAGCGADAAPYFRVFNPAIQGARFDPGGSWVRRWVPELGRVPGAFVHAPWAAPAAVLEGAGVRLGRTYPLPVVEHAAARQRARDAHAAFRGRRR